MPDADLMETVEKPSRMQRFQDWLAVIANLSVLAGIVFVAIELRQNTTAIEAQTRDSIADKQMNYYGMLATNPELASVVVTATSQGMDSLDPVQQRMWIGFASVVFTEWENSQYQYQLGLFSTDEFDGRIANMRKMMATPGFRAAWKNERLKFSSNFQSLIDPMTADDSKDAWKQ
ncbi:MAG TPA: hypothetical protein PK018_17385 [Candidatus Competibacter sp.]|nr:hypothetical protein [Candidatus Competibacter sp.]